MDLLPPCKTISVIPRGCKGPERSTLKSLPSQFSLQHCPRGVFLTVFWLRWSNQKWSNLQLPTLVDLCYQWLDQKERKIGLHYFKNILSTHGYILAWKQIPLFLCFTISSLPTFPFFLYNTTLDTTRWPLESPTWLPTPGLTRSLTLLTTSSIITSVLPCISLFKSLLSHTFTNFIMLLW